MLSPSPDRSNSLSLPSPSPSPGSDNTLGPRSTSLLLSLPCREEVEVGGDWVWLRAAVGACQHRRVHHRGTRGQGTWGQGTWGQGTRGQGTQGRLNVQSKATKEQPQQDRSERLERNFHNRLLGTRDHTGI